MRKKFSSIIVTSLLIGIQHSNIVSSGQFIGSYSFTKSGYKKIGLETIVDAK